MSTSFNLSALVREDLKGMVPYDAPYYPDVIKLDANENPYDFPPSVLAQIFREVESGDLCRYPDAAAVALRKRLSDYISVRPENIMVGNGSDELILNLMLTFGAGAQFAVATPTFSMYGVHGRIASGTLLEVPRLEDYRINVDGLINAASKPEVKVVVICSPNSPTGNATPAGEIEKVLRQANAIVVVDEAYNEFGGESCVPLLGSYANLVILRTFSKAFGMAGLRVGYLLAHTRVISELLKVKQPYNLNVFSQAAACAVMRNLPLFEERFKNILQERDKLYEELSEISGVQAFPTQANFIMFRTALPADKIYNELLGQGVLIRNVDGPLLPGCLRVSLGTAEENKIFLDKLKKIINSG
ncbi:MAG: histidinol-phosphate transaminase [Desulfotomaculaceae bacterium]|nr:histidinol-phosphate transaminase [Desulfotomaculaceae bacterium]MDD4766259.1 histidinol-phosphate transaminase [Desulfotomaculaceae bacterium]